MDWLLVVFIVLLFVLRGLIYDEKIFFIFSDNSFVVGMYWVFNGCLIEIVKG